jgi:hypothetical protein
LRSALPNAGNSFCEKEMYTVKDRRMKMKSFFICMIVGVYKDKNYCG